MSSFLKPWSLFLSVLVVCLLLGCGGKDTSGPGSVPVITAFSASSTPVDAGAKVELSWAVSGATTLSIDQGVGTVTGRTSLSVAPSQTTTYTLTASNAAGNVSARTTIQVKVAVSLDQTSLVLVPGSTQRFTATVKGSPAGVTWSVQEPDGGWITSDGVYIAPAMAGVFHVLATSQADTTASAQATVTVDSVGIAILPGAASMVPRSTLTLASTVTGASADAGVTWSVPGNDGGTLVDKGDGKALYTAPDVPGTYLVQAASVEDPTKTATAVLTVNQVTVSVSPVDQHVLVGASLPFSATITGTSNAAVAWSVVEPEGGSIASSGLYTAPATAGIYHIQATSMADASVSATVPVQVESVGVSLSPALVTLAPGQTQQFAAQVTGTEDTRITWQIQETGGGQIDASGAYTAPAMTGTYHVVAYSVEDPSQSATATVSVPSRTLTVGLGSNASGTPSTGVAAVQGQMITYHYAADAGYSLQVQVDGVAAPASGTLVMDQDHVVTVSATLDIVLRSFCTLTTTVTGAVGAPVDGSQTFDQGTVVSYGYALQSGYTNLTVTLDGTPVPPTGSFTMNANHTLKAIASQQVVVVLPTRTLTVTTDANCGGLPATTTTFDQGTKVTYAYTLKATAPSYLVVSVLLDGKPVAATDTITMTDNHTLSVQAEVPPLTIHIDGVNSLGPGNAVAYFTDGQPLTLYARVSGGAPPYSYCWKHSSDPGVLATTPYLTFTSMPTDVSYEFQLTDQIGVYPPVYFFIDKRSNP
jgi:hypothetical protein